MSKIIPQGIVLPFIAPEPLVVVVVFELVDPVSQIEHELLPPVARRFPGNQAGFVVLTDIVLLVGIWVVLRLLGVLRLVVIDVGERVLPGQINFNLLVNLVLFVAGVLCVGMLLLMVLVRGRLRKQHLVHLQPPLYQLGLQLFPVQFEELLPCDYALDQIVARGQDPRLVEHQVVDVPQVAQRCRVVDLYHLLPVLVLAVHVLNYLFLLVEHRKQQHQVHYPVQRDRDYLRVQDYIRKKTLPVTRNRIVVQDKLDVFRLCHKHNHRNRRDYQH